MHHHPQAQVCIVIEGAMVVRAEDGTEERMGPGSATFFAPDEPHAVINPLDVPSIVIEVFVSGRPFDFWLKRFGMS